MFSCVLSLAIQTRPTLAVMADGLQEQVDEYSQLLCLATCQETQDNGGPGDGARLTLKLAARFTAQTTKQDPVKETANTKSRRSKRHKLNICR